jgi:hypothetical protein
MIGTTKCPQVRPVISVANIYCHELEMRVFNNKLKVTEIEIGSYLNPAASRSNEPVQLCEIEVPVPLHCPDTMTHSNANFGMCANVLDDYMQFGAKQSLSKICNLRNK